MSYYNLVAEYASLIVICIAIIGFALDEDKSSTRYRALRWMQFATLISIIVTIWSLITADYFMYFPVWVVELFKYLYFLTSPILAPIALIYAITVMYPKTHKIDFAKKYSWAWIPYAIYCGIILTNGIHRFIFTISPTEGYVRGEFFKITYVISLLYILLVILFAIKNIKTPQRNILLVICFNLFVCSLIFCAQLIFLEVQLSGLACVSGVLIMQFYVHNVTQKTDSLTELYNRATLTISMEKLCKAGTPFSLFVFSIRNFKGVNERNGLKFGDDILEQVGRRLREYLHHRQIFRYSGDEFALLLPNYKTSENQNIEKLYEGIKEGYEIKNHMANLDFLHARVDYPEFGNKAEEIISAMDYSLFIAKKESDETSCFYEISVCDKMKRRNYVIERIKKALRADGFEAYYQPIYSARKKDFTMAEALIRFKEEEGEFISPAEFIPIAEETGLIDRITRKMIELVCVDYRKMLDSLGENIRVKSISINFPYEFFRKEGAADEVEKMVRKHNILPEQIKIELTERVLATDVDKNLKIMNEFTVRGFAFELDDFGVEYSNFNMFFNVPIHIVKFDKSLVENSTRDEQRKDFFAKFVVAIKAVDKDLEIVMEGVETEEIKDFLLECGGDYIQGYIYSKPLPWREYVEFIS